jgi:ethanolamine utilization microcompartment shell protein EutS
MHPRTADTLTRSLGVAGLTLGLTELLAGAIAVVAGFVSVTFLLRYSKQA